MSRANSPFIRRLEHGLPPVAILRGMRTREAFAIGRTPVETGFEIIEVPLSPPTPLATLEAPAAALYPPGMTAEEVRRRGLAFAGVCSA